MMLEIAVTIALPAIVVVLLYKEFLFSRGLLYTLLALAFILSWSIILLRVRRLEKKLKALDEQLVREVERTKQ